MPKAANTPTTGGGRPLPLELIDLAAHPDGELMRMCAEATNLFDALVAWRNRPTPDYPLRDLAGRFMRLHEAIADTDPLSTEGWQTKAIYCLLDDGTFVEKGGPIHRIAYAVIADALRLAVLP